LGRRAVVLDKLGVEIESSSGHIWHSHEYISQV
jgi:hypothetical protein